MLMRNILIVEDEIILAMMNRQIVENAGYTVVGSVTKGEDAIEFVKKHECDLILMDIFLEGETDGISAVEIIRKFSGIPVIYVTGNSDPKAKKRAKKTNYSSFLVKPVLPDVLINAIEETY